MFILIVFINAFFIIDTNEDADYGNSVHLQPFFYEVYAVFYIVHLVLSFTVIAIEMIERYPLLAYYKGMVIEKHRPEGLLEVTWMFCRDSETMYYVVYCIVTCLGFISSVFYSLLL